MLIIDPDASAALRLQAELAQAAGRRVWLWHERSISDALTALSVFQFELVLLAPSIDEGPHADATRTVQQLAPGTIVVLYGDEVSGSTVLRLLGLTEQSRDES